MGQDSGEKYKDIPNSQLDALGDLRPSTPPVNTICQHRLSRVSTSAIDRPVQKLGISS